METTIEATERAWDARVAHLLTKLPVRLRSGVEWLREPSRRPLRLGAAVLLVLGGFLSVLPVFGLWMLPLGLALMSDELPLPGRFWKSKKKLAPPNSPRLRSPMKTDGLHCEPCSVPGSLPRRSLNCRSEGASVMARV